MRSRNIVVLITLCALLIGHIARAEDVGDKIARVGKKAREGTSKIVDKTTKALKHAGGRTAEGIKKGGTKTSEALHKATNKTKQWVEQKSK